MHIITQVSDLAFILPLAPPQLHHPVLSVCPPEYHLGLSSPFHLHEHDFASGPYLLLFKLLQMLPNDLSDSLVLYPKDHLLSPQKSNTTLSPSIQKSIKQTMCRSSWNLTEQEIFKDCRHMISSRLISFLFFCYESNGISY